MRYNSNVKKRRKLDEDVAEQLQMRDWRRRVFNLADVGLPWIPIFGQNVYLRNTQQERKPMHCHEDCVEFVFCKKGVCRFETKFGKIRLKAGMAYVSKPGEFHRRTDLRQGSETNYFMFRLPKGRCRLKGLSAIESSCLVARVGNLPSVVRCGENLSARFHRVFLLAESPRTPERDMLIKCAVVELLAGLRTEPESNGVRSALSSGVRKISKEMYERPHLPWTMDELTTRLFASLPSVVKQFKEVTGFAPHAYLMRCRVARAKRLLSDKSLTLSAIAIRLGFSTTQHLINAFKNAFGVPPGAWRKSQAGATGAIK